MSGADSDVAVFRAANPGCYEPHSASGMSTTVVSLRYQIETVQVVTDFPLIRRLRRHLPPRRGRLSEVLQITKSELQTFRLQAFRCQYFKAETKEIRTIAFPFKGEGGAVGDG